MGLVGLKKNRSRFEAHPPPSPLQVSEDLKSLLLLGFAAALQQMLLRRSLKFVPREEAKQLHG